MAGDPGLEALVEVAALRGQLTILHEGLARVADRVDGVIDADREDRQRAADERVASRRYTLTTTIAASVMVLGAVGVFANALAGGL